MAKCKAQIHKTRTRKKRAVHENCCDAFSTIAFSRLWCAHAHTHTHHLAWHSFECCSVWIFRVLFSVSLSFTSFWLALTKFGIIAPSAVAAAKSVAVLFGASSRSERINLSPFSGWFSSICDFIFLLRFMRKNSFSVCWISKLTTALSAFSYNFLDLFRWQSVK